MATQLAGRQLKNATVTETQLAASVAGNGLTGGAGTALTVGGTASRIVVGADAVDIDAGYVGQTSITTLGTIATGVWSGTALVAAKVPALDAITAPAADVSLNSKKITNLLDPTAAQDAASKAYVDSVATGLRDFKNSVRVATAAALPAYTRTANVITASANGALAAVDGVTLSVNDRLLLKDGAAGADNGLYYVSAVGDVTNPYTLTRTTDADVSAEVTAGTFLFVTEGTTNGDTGWVLSTNDPITLNTTALTFVQFTALGQITAGAGMTKTGATLDVIAADTSITVGADNLQVNLAASSGLDISSGLRIAAAAGGAGIGGGGGSALFLDWVREAPSGAINGSNVTFTVTSTPAPTPSLHVFLNGLLQEPVGVDYTISGTTITMATAPLTGETLIASYAK